MSDVDPTPGSPVTIGDRLAWMRGDLASNLAALLGTPAGTLADIVEGLYTQTNPRYPYMVQLGTKLDDISQRLDAIQAVLGAAPYSSTETANIRALLMQLVLNQGQIGISPDGSLTDYTQSQGSIGIEGRRYLLWNNISGLTTSSDGRRLTPITDWDGYSIYIQTDAPSAIKHNITTPTADVNPFPVNSWTDLTGSTDEYSWSVDASYEAKGYIRHVVQAYTFTTVFVGGTWHQVPNWSPLPTVANYVAGCAQNMLGWTAAYVSGTARIRFKPFNSDTPYATLSPGETKQLSSFADFECVSGSHLGDGSGQVTFTLTPP